MPKTTTEKDKNYLPVSKDESMSAKIRAAYKNRAIYNKGFIEGFSKGEEALSEQLNAKYRQMHLEAVERIKSEVFSEDVLAAVALARIKVGEGYFYTPEMIVQEVKKTRGL